jgi:MoxR-like ATPase
MEQSEELNQLEEIISEQHAVIEKIKLEMDKAIIGQEHLIDSLLIALLADGHILLEGVPGLAKTLAIKALARAINVKFSRIQFTPDLLPADLIGTMIYSQKQENFVVKKGPVFANFILADEINRSPAKVQSALLEAMQERQVTIGEQTFKLPDPFLVMATQNPLEQEGTYPLPEAQVDRFMLKVIVKYPKLEEERKIIHLNLKKQYPMPDPVVSADEIIKLRDTVRKIYMSEKVEDYILNLVFATRQPENYGLEKLKPLIRYGASPRASIFLTYAAKARAFIKKRAYILPDDIKSVIHDVLRHRIGLTYEAEAENITSEDIITEILNVVEVP